jgi:hypothetical protein
LVSIGQPVTRRDRSLSSVIVILKHKAFKSEFGHCFVPEGLSFGTWRSKMRYTYMQIQQGKNRIIISLKIG